MTITKTVIWGRTDGHLSHWGLFVGGFFLIYVGVYVLGLLFGSQSPDGRLLNPLAIDLIGGLIFVGPAAVSALSAYFRGGALVSLAIGLTPTAATVVTELIGGVLDIYSSDEIGYYLMMYAAIGVGGALIGFVVGTGGRLLVNQFIH